MEYSKIPYLPWSQSKGKDNVIMDSSVLAHMEKVVYLEKLDGESTFMSADVIHGPSQNTKYNKPWQTYLKKLWSQDISRKIPKDIGVYVENMYAIHSIEYDNLTSAFYVFDVINLENRVHFNWDYVLGFCQSLELPVVPEIQRSPLAELSIPEVSSFGPICEGYVCRSLSAFYHNDFGDKIGKCTRSNHVESSLHSSKNWKRANIDDRSK